MVMASIDEVLLVPIEVNTFCMWDTKPPWNADLQKSVLKSRLLAFPIVNATYRTRFSRFTIPKREKLQLQIPMATQVGELPDVVTYPIAHELDPPPWHTAYPTNVRTYPIWTKWHTASKQALFLLA